MKTSHYRKTLLGLTLLLGLAGIGKEKALGQSQVFTVGVADTLVLHDGSRDRDIPLKIYYPKTSFPQTFPVIIFSHGAGGSKDGYSYLGEFWASQGYICIHPQHLGSDSAILRKGRPLLTLRAITQSVEDTQNWINRPLDISFVINSFPFIEQQIPALKDRLDRTRIGVAGHSFGAYTAIALDGAVIYMPGGTPRNFTDSRIKAFIAMSPQGLGHMGFAENSWDGITRPTLTMSGTKDKELGGGAASERLEAFQHMPAGDKFHILLKDVTHMDFSGRQLTGRPTRPEIQEFIETTGLRFWNAYLKKKGAFPQLLNLSTGQNTLNWKGIQATYQSK